MKKPKEVNIRINEEARQRLKMAALKGGITLKALIDKLSLKI